MRFLLFLILLTLIGTLVAARREPKIRENLRLQNYRPGATIRQHQESSQPPDIPPQIIGWRDTAHVSERSNAGSLPGQGPKEVRVDGFLNPLEQEISSYLDKRQEITISAAEKSTISSNEKIIVEEVGSTTAVSSEVTTTMISSVPSAPLPTSTTSSVTSSPSTEVTSQLASNTPLPLQPEVGTIEAEDILNLSLSSPSSSVKERETLNVITLSSAAEDASAGLGNSGELEAKTGAAKRSSSVDEENKATSGSPTDTSFTIEPSPTSLLGGLDRSNNHGPESYDADREANAVDYSDFEPSLFGDTEGSTTSADKKETAESTQKIIDIDYEDLPPLYEDSIAEDPPPAYEDESLMHNTLARNDYLPTVDSGETSSSTTQESSPNLTDSTGLSNSAQLTIPSSSTATIDNPNESLNINPSGNEYHTPVQNNLPEQPTLLKEEKEQDFTLQTVVEVHEEIPRITQTSIVFPEPPPACTHTTSDEESKCKPVEIILAGIKGDATGFDKYNTLRYISLNLLSVIFVILAMGVL